MLPSILQSVGLLLTALRKQVLRQNLYLSSSDEEKLDLYKGAFKLLKDLPLASFLPKEVSWLVSTCFNRGCQHAKFCRHSSATAFMDTAIKLLDFCPDLEAKRAVRLDIVASKAYHL